jgi:DNA-binding response OmpR family regulator
MSRILVVEDDRDIAELIAHYLQKAGHTAEVVPTGTAALPRARDHAPDLLILDRMLPGMDRVAGVKPATARSALR